MVTPQVAITTTHGAASDDKNGQTDDPQSSKNKVKYTTLGKIASEGYIRYKS